MDRRGGTSEVVDLVHLQIDRLGNIVADELEVGMADQMADIVLVAGKEIVQTQNVVTLGKEPVAEVGAQKTRAAGDQYSFHLHGGKTLLKCICHLFSPLSAEGRKQRPSQVAFPDGKTENFRLYKGSSWQCQDN